MMTACSSGRVARATVESVHLRAKRLGGRSPEAIKAQDTYLGEAVGGDDEGYAYALEVMKRRWHHPISGTGWYGAIKLGFAVGPEESAKIAADSELGGG